MPFIRNYGTFFTIFGRFSLLKCCFILEKVGIYKVKEIVLLVHLIGHLREQYFRMKWDPHAATQLFYKITFHKFTELKIESTYMETL